MFSIKLLTSWQRWMCTFKDIYSNWSTNCSVLKLRLGDGDNSARSSQFNALPARDMGPSVVALSIATLLARFLPYAWILWYTVQSVLYTVAIVFIFLVLGRLKKEAVSKITYFKYWALYLLSDILFQCPNSHRWLCKCTLFSASKSVHDVHTSSCQQSHSTVCCILYSWANDICQWWHEMKMINKRWTRELFIVISNILL